MITIYGVLYYLFYIKISKQKHKCFLTKMKVVVTDKKLLNFFVFA